MERSVPQTVFLFTEPMSVQTSDEQGHCGLLSHRSEKAANVWHCFLGGAWRLRGGLQRSVPRSPKQKHELKLLNSHL